MTWWGFASNLTAYINLKFMIVPEDHDFLNGDVLPPMLSCCRPWLHGCEFWGHPCAWELQSLSRHLTLRFDACAVTVIKLSLVQRIKIQDNFMTENKKSRDKDFEGIEEGLENGFCLFKSWRFIYFCLSITLLTLEFGRCRYIISLKIY